VTRRARHDLGSFAAERVEVFPERVDVLRGVLVDRQAGFLRLRDDAIFDVRDVHHVRDLVAFEFQIAANDVGRDGAAEIADVAVFPDGWTTVIEPHLAFVDWAKLFNASRECVTKPQHGDC
jgi:hypothetical protein